MSSGTPDYNLLLGQIWGNGCEGGPDSGVSLADIGVARNIFAGSNPPYYATDFFAMYPAFGGTPTAVTGAVDGTTAVIVLAAAPPSSVGSGQLVAGAGIPDGAVILSIAGNNLTINVNTTVAGAAVPITIWTAPAIPLPVLNAYIMLASACVYQGRYFDSWSLCMGLFIAHYATLWAQANQNPGTSLAQIAAAGLAIGIKTHKAAGNVSVGQAILNDLQGWGTFQLTLYGQEFASIAKVLASGGALFY